MSAANKPLNVLIVEDDDSDAAMIERQLEQSRFNFHPTFVYTLHQAVEAIKQKAFDAVVADMNLPDCSGIETISKLRACGKRSAILAMTSYVSEEIEDDILAAGALDFRTKEELCSDSLARAIVQTVQRQADLNHIKRLVRRLKRNQNLLRDQAQQLKHKNSRLKKLYRTAREFVDNVSHDLRTPLTVIKDYVSILRDGMAGDVNQEQNKLLGKVAIRADDLNHMVDDILDASKLEAGLLGAWRRPASVPQIVANASSLLRERASIKGIELVNHCPDDLPEVYCDSDKAVRVICNLAVNAINHSEAGTKVSLWAKYHPIEAEVVIGVTDEGPGIEKECLEKIFQRFEQLDDEVSSTVKGYGLGLNIAQRLARINLGELGVESEPGKGSTFKFTVPLAEPSEVFWRWLDKRESSPYPLVALELAVGDTVPERDADDFDRYVNCLLRRQDILFRISKRVWLLVMPISEKDLPRWEERASRDFVRFNRNRPAGPLPGYSRRVVCQWSAQITARKIHSEFDRILQQEFREELAGQLSMH